MDYKYIEQLLEQYWECQTSREEEDILRSFFAQDDVPVSLLPYRSLFLAEQEMVDECQPDKDFDSRMMQLVDGRNPNRVKARKVSMAVRLNPFYKVAAVVGAVLSIGLAAQYGWEAPQGSGVKHGDLYVMDSTGVTPFDAATATANPVTDTLFNRVDAAIQ